MTIGLSKIMVGIDGSEESVNAADYAIAIAKRHNAELIAVNVLTSDIGYAYSSPGVESPPLTIRETILLAEDEVKKGLMTSKKKQIRMTFSSGQR
jgi:nucleotide-binding universal stress UspA family protein